MRNVGATWAIPSARISAISCQSGPSQAPRPDHVIAHTNLHWAYQTAPGRTASRSRPKTSTSRSSTLGVRVLTLQMHSDLAARQGGGP